MQPSAVVLYSLVLPLLHLFRLAPSFLVRALCFGSHRACTLWWPAARSWIAPCSPYTHWPHRSATSSALWTLWRPCASNPAQTRNMEHREDGRGQGCLHVNTFAQVAHTHPSLTHCAPLDPPGTTATEHAQWSPFIFPPLDHPLKMSAWWDFKGTSDVLPFDFKVSSLHLTNLN